MTFEKDNYLTPAYQKDAEDEVFLAKLNSILGAVQEQEYQDMPENFPTIHIVGVPRSGTTLLNQLIATHLNVGFINNLIAAFWQAPVYGIRLSKKLLPPRLPSDYHSDFGRTTHIHEPHEFGYFWAQVFGDRSMLYKAESDIDWQHLRKVLVNMTNAYGCPIVFKSPQLGFYMQIMQQWLPKTCFIRVTRQPLDTALSILKYRERFLGCVDRWVSLKPTEYKWLQHEPYWTQVAGQVHYCEQAMTRQIQAVNGHNILDVAYEELCADPQSILTQVQLLAQANGADIEQVSQPPASFTLSQSSTPAHWREQVSEALQQLRVTSGESGGSIEP